VSEPWIANNPKPNRNRLQKIRQHLLKAALFIPRGVLQGAPTESTSGSDAAFTPQEVSGGDSSLLKPG